MDALFTAILLLGLLVGLMCICIGVWLLFKRSSSRMVELELSHFGKIKTAETGIVLNFLGLFLFAFSTAGYQQARKAVELKTELDRVLITTATNLHDEFHAVVAGHRPPVSPPEFGRVDRLIGFLQQIDSRNGHALYYAGEVARAEGNINDEQENFYKYLEVQDTVPESEKGGDVGSEVCYKRPSGFCRQRSGWIHHLLANDFYSEGLSATNAQDKAYYFNKASDLIKASFADYPDGFGGQGQVIPTIALKEDIAEQLQSLVK
jgi:hypothetical protein